MRFDSDLSIIAVIYVINSGLHFYILVGKYVFVAFAQFLLNMVRRVWGHCCNSCAYCQTLLHSCCSFLLWFRRRTYNTCFWPDYVIFLFIGFESDLFIIIALLLSFMWSTVIYFSWEVCYIAFAQFLLNMVRGVWGHCCNSCAYCQTLLHSCCSFLLWFRRRTYNTCFWPDYVIFCSWDLNLTFS